MSILVITTITGTFRARAMPRCSLVLCQPLHSPQKRLSSVLAHADETVICGDHEQAVVGTAA